MISRRDSYEACVLPGISPAVLSFPYVRGVERCLLEAGGNSDINAMPEDVSEAFFNKQNWFVLFTCVLTLCSKLLFVNATLVVEWKINFYPMRDPL